MTLSCKRVAVLHEALLVVVEESWLINHNKQQRHAAINIVTSVAPHHHHTIRHRKLRQEESEIRGEVTRRAHFKEIFVNVLFAFFGHHCTRSLHTNTSLQSSRSCNLCQRIQTKINFGRCDGFTTRPHRIIGAHNSQIN